jgi:hypothetical protein
VHTPELDSPLSGEWTIKEWKTSDGKIYAFPIPRAWADYVRDLLRVAGEAI